MNHTESIIGIVKPKAVCKDKIIGTRTSNVIKPTKHNKRLNRRSKAVLNGHMLIDCGKSFKWTLEQLNYELPDAILLTHEHGDHSKAAKKFLERGVEMYMTQGTADALKLSRHNLHVIRVGETFTVGGLTVEAIESIHDAAEPVNFILQDDLDRVLYVTDTGELPDVDGDFTKIFIEANYELMKLFNAPIPNRQRARIIATHLSIRQAARFTKKYPQAEVTYLHQSNRHGRLTP